MSSAPAAVTTTRPAAATKGIPSLDGMRAVSVMAVFLGHAGLPSYVGPATGVTIFFFLSGYLITTLLRMEHDRTGRINLRDFYLRRVLRIFPPMYIALVACVLLDLAVRDGMTWTGFVAAATQWVNYYQVVAGPEGLPMGSGIFWSLAVEEHFYLAFPVLYIALLRWTADRRRHALVIGALCGVILVWRTWVVLGTDLDRHWTDYATDVRADSILLGCLFAIIANPVLDGVRVSRRSATWVLFPLGAALTAFTALMPPEFAFTIGYNLQAAGLALVFVALIGYPDTVFGRLMNWRPVAFLGVLSYSVYLFHRIVQIPIEIWVTTNPIIVGAISFPLTLGIAYLMLKLVEEPCGRLRRRLSHAGVARGARPGEAQR